MHPQVVNAKRRAVKKRMTWLPVSANGAHVKVRASDKRLDISLHWMDITTTLPPVDWQRQRQISLQWMDIGTTLVPCWLAIQVWSVTWADICRTDTQDPGFISDHFPFNGRPLPRRPVQLGTPNLIKTSTVKQASSTGTVWSTRISSRDSFILTSRGWGPERVCQKY